MSYGIWDAAGAGAVQAYNNTSVSEQNGVPVNANESMQSKWWEGGNVSGYADSLATLLQAFSGKTKGPDTVIYQQDTSKDDKEGMSTGVLIAIIIAIVLFLIVILMLAYRRKKSA